MGRREGETKEEYKARKAAKKEKKERKRLEADGKKQEEEGGGGGGGAGSSTSGVSEEERKKKKKAEKKERKRREKEEEERRKSKAAAADSDSEEEDGAPSSKRSGPSTLTSSEEKKVQAALASGSKKAKKVAQELLPSTVCITVKQPHAAAIAAGLKQVVNHNTRLPLDGHPDGRWVILHAGAGDDKDQSHIAELKEATPSLFKGPSVEVRSSMIAIFHVSRVVTVDEAKASGSITDSPWNAGKCKWYWLIDSVVPFPSPIEHIPGRLGLWEPLPALHLFAALASKKASLITSSALKSLIKDDIAEMQRLEAERKEKVSDGRVAAKERLENDPVLKAKKAEKRKSSKVKQEEGLVPAIFRPGGGIAWNYSKKQLGEDIETFDSIHARMKELAALFGGGDAGSDGDDEDEDDDDGGGSEKPQSKRRKKDEPKRKVVASKAGKGKGTEAIERNPAAAAKAAKAAKAAAAKFAAAAAALAASQERIDDTEDDEDGEEHAVAQALKSPPKSPQKSPKKRRKEREERNDEEDEDEDEEPVSKKKKKSKKDKKKRRKDDDDTESD